MHKVLTMFEGEFPSSLACVAQAQPATGMNASGSGAYLNLRSLLYEIKGSNSMARKREGIMDILIPMGESRPFLIFHSIINPCCNSTYRWIQHTIQQIAGRKNQLNNIPTGSTVANFSNKKIVNPGSEQHPG